MDWYRDMVVPPKDPLAVKDYLFQWADWLTGDEIIATAVVTAATGLTLDTSSLEDSDTSVLAWFSGGTAGVRYEVECKIVTDSSPARTEYRTIIVEVADQ
jgi:hypothetical protein